MSDIFVSYKREDRERANLLASALRGAGLHVWFDQDIPGGEPWRQRILAQLESAKCVIVLWSENSVGPAADFVIDEANHAKRRGTLLPVRIDTVEPPLGFGEINALDLVDWNGDPADAKFADVVEATKARIAGAPLPTPKGSRRRKTVAWATMVTFVSTAVFAAILGTGPSFACRIPGVQRLCGELGIAGAPSRAEQTLWSGRRPGDCTVLRTYLTQFPNRAYAEEARSRLAAATIETQETWTLEERRLPLVVRAALQPFVTRQQAEADALVRAQAEAQGLCASYDLGEFRLRSARAVLEEWRCAERQGGFACVFDGKALCQVEIRQEHQIEECP